MPYDMYGNWYPGGPGGPFDFYGGHTGFGGPVGPAGPWGMAAGPYAPASYAPPAPWEMPYGPLTDADIKDMVEDNLAADLVISRRDFDNIEVNVDDGVVTLSGEVTNRRAKHHSYLAAFWTYGVVDVVNNLKVKEKEKERGRREPAEARQPAMAGAGAGRTRRR